MMQGIRDRYSQLPTYAQYGIPAAGLGTIGLGAMAMGTPQQPAVQAMEATGQPNANEQSMVGDNVNLALKRQVYGDPLSDMEALQQAAKLSGNLYKFPEKKEKAIRDAEIEGQLMALQAEALRNQYLN